MQNRTALPIAALLVFAACDGGPAGLPDNVPGEIIVTAGIPAPARVVAPIKPDFSTLEGASPSLGGSSTTPLSINGTACSAHPGQQVTISYTLTGNQASPASVRVYTTWDYNGTSFVGSNPTTINFPVKSGGGSVQYQVTINVTNSSGAGTGTTSFTVTPFDLVTNTSDPSGQQLSLAASSSATVHVAFNDCTPSNTAPSITVPADITIEAEGPTGAVVSFIVTANDAEQGDISHLVICTPASGSTFPLGPTTVNCSVTDNGGLQATGSFEVDVVDTTPPVISGAPTGTVTLIAENINGATFDASGITASDLVDGSVSVQCSPLSGGIGVLWKVTCTATDNAGNPGTAEFYVEVTLNVGGVAFLSPLRMEAPFSAHKLNSAIPHKFPAPKYADGTLATDLASGLRLVLTPTAVAVYAEEFAADGFTAGSTVWRYDADEQHYIFNLKTGNKSPWAHGTWVTTVEYAGITLASTTVSLKQ